MCPQHQQLELQANFFFYRQFLKSCSALLFRELHPYTFKMLTGFKMINQFGKTYSTNVLPLPPPPPCPTVYLGDKGSSAQQRIYNPTIKWLQERSEKVHAGSHIHSIETMIDTMNKINNEREPTVQLSSQMW